MNNIDDLFRKGTEQHYPVDEALWAAVEPQLPQTAFSKSPWYYSLNSIVLAAVLLTCSFIPKDNSRTITAENNASTVIATTKINSKLALPKKEQLALNSKYPTQKPSKTPAEKPQKLAATNKQEVENEHRSAAHKQTVPNKITSNSVQSEAFKSVKTNTITPTWNTKKQANLSTPFNSGIETKIENRKRASLLANIDALTEYVDIRNKPIDLRPSGSENSLKRKPSRPYYNVELEALLSFAISKNINGGQENILETKRTGENSLELRTLGLNLIGQKKFLIYGAGIQQSQYLERFSYSVDVEKSRMVSKYDTNYRVVNGNFNSNGTPVMLIEQQVTESQRSEKYTAKDRLGGINTIKWIGIPLFVGVQKSFRNWQANVRFSIISQYSYHASGYYIGDDLNSIDVISEEDINSLHFSNRNDVSLGYNFHEQFAVGAKFALLQDLNSFTKRYDSKLNSKLVGVWLIWKPQ